MVFTGVTLVVHNLSELTAVGHAATARAGAIVATTQISMFAAFFAVAIANLRRPEIHKRAIAARDRQLNERRSGSSRLRRSRPPRRDVDRRFRARAQPGQVLVAGVGGAPRRRPADSGGDRVRLADARPTARIYVIGGACVLAVQVLRIPLAQTAIGRSLTDLLWLSRSDSRGE